MGRRLVVSVRNIHYAGKWSLTLPSLLRQEAVQAEIPERLIRTWEKSPKEMQEFERLA